MKRRNLFGGFLGALGVARAQIVDQDNPCFVRDSKEGYIIGTKCDPGAQKPCIASDPRACWPSGDLKNHLMWERTGKAVNNQCPACGTMAAPYRVELNCMGWDYKPVPCGPEIQQRRIDCARCNATFRQFAEEPKK